MRISYLLAFLFLISCSSTNSHVSEVEEWRKKRIKSLTAPIGWASLSGLYWLDKDTLSIGGENQDMVLTKSIENPVAMVYNETGNWIFEGLTDGIQSETSSDQKIKISTGIDGKPTTLTWKQFQWTFIERGGKTGMRVWDTTHVNRSKFTELDYFPIDENFKIKANFVPYDPPLEITLKNVLGMDIPQTIPGELQFNIAGKDLTIQPLNGGEDEFFIIFADETTSGETYGGGRYLYIPKPEGGKGECYIDFNLSYTPPCGFTEYATCLLPTKENTLPVEIRAGEMYLFDH